MDEKLTIYIAGPMAGDPDYKTKFDAAESYLLWKGWIVLNPAVLPEGLMPDAYLPICLAMVDAADALVTLKGSEDSNGANIEKAYAKYQKKIVYNGLEEVPLLKEDESDA